MLLFNLRDFAGKPSKSFEALCLCSLHYMTQQTKGVVMLYSNRVNRQYCVTETSNRVNRQYCVTETKPIHAIIECDCDDKDLRLWLRKMSASMFFGFMQLRSLVTVSPAVGKILSDGVDVAGIVRIFWESEASRGYL